MLALGACLLASSTGRGQDETTYMSVLSSRKHRLNASDNPVVVLYVSKDRGMTWEHRGWREYIRVFYTEAGPDGILWSACGNGVLRSADGGVTWRISTGWEITEVLKVHVSPTNPETVFGATAYGIIRTTDSGKSWSAMTRGFHRTFTSDFCVDRARPAHILAASEEGVYESEDNGNTWNLGTLRGIVVNVIAQHPLNEREFFAGTEDNGLFRSTNGGKSWHVSKTSLSRLTIYALAFDPSSPSTVFAGTYGGGVYRSVDGGTTWLQKDQGLQILDVHSLVVLQGRPSVVLAGTLNGGLYRSIDGGDHWTFNSQEEAQVWGLSTTRVK